MAITRQKQLFYFVNGTPYASLEEAQKVDLIGMMPEQWNAEHKEFTSNWLMMNSEAIVATLSTTPRSRARKPRSDIGKPRKKKAAATSPVAA